MIVAHNLLAMNANRQFNINNKRKVSVTEKLSSGYKINRAADDAAGLAMSEKLRRQIRGLNQASQNVQDGISYVQVADGALNEVHDILHRMNELAVKSANGTLTPEDRGYLDSEVQQLKSELDRIFDTTSFNERKIWEPDPDTYVPIAWEKKQAVAFKDTSAGVSLTNANCGVLAHGGYTINADQSGVNVSWTGWDGNSYATETEDDIPIRYDALSTIYLGVDEVSVETPDGCNETITAIKDAMRIVSNQRADFGAYQNRLEHTYNNNKNVEENTQYAESRIRDTDMAKAAMEFANLDILGQAGQAMLAQANVSNQGVLQLLQNG